MLIQTKKLRSSLYLIELGKVNFVNNLEFVAAIDILRKEV